MCIRNNLEDDKYECIKVVKYAPRNINDINDLETFVENKNNNDNSLLFKSNSKVESNIFEGNIYESQIEENKIKDNLKSEKLKNEEEIKEEIKENSNENNIEEDETDIINYPEKLLNIINFIRTQPKIYADKIDYAVKYIKFENQTIIDKETGEKKNIGKPFFKKKVKVSLNKGEQSFFETSKILREMKSIPPLKMDKNLLINLPNNIKDLYDNKYLIKQAEKNKKKYALEIFYKDLIKDPNISALLMVVDDNEKNDLKKRNAILNPDFKFIGINCRFIGKTFIAYLGFSK